MKHAEVDRGRHVASCGSSVRPRRGFLTATTLRPPNEHLLSLYLSTLRDFLDANLRDAILYVLIKYVLHRMISIINIINIFLLSSSPDSILRESLQTLRASSKLDFEVMILFLSLHFTSSFRCF